MNPLRTLPPLPARFPARSGFPPPPHRLSGRPLLPITRFLSVPPPLGALGVPPPSPLGRGASVLKPERQGVLSFADSAWRGWPTVRTLAIAGGRGGGKGTPPPQGK